MALDERCFAAPCLAELSSVLQKKSIILGCDIDRVASYWDVAPTRALALSMPNNTSEVSEVMRICHKYKQPVVTQGGKTNCVQSANSNPEEIILSTEKLNQIESIDIVNAVASVEAGVVLQTLQKACLEKDMLFPLDLGSRGSCTIGGNVSTNAGGISVLRYGMMRDLVLGLEAVLSDGTIVSSMNQMLKNNSAYDVKQLFIGSEGTLGVVTRAVVKLVPKPLSCQTVLIGVVNFSDVIEILNETRRRLAGILSAFEVMWGPYFQAVTEDGGHSSPISRGHGYYVLLEAEGSDPERDDQLFQKLLEQLYLRGAIEDAVVAQSEADRIGLWQIREDFGVILEDTPVFLYDVSLPISSMEEYVDLTIKAVKEKWSLSEVYALGHIADGNIHFFVRPNAGPATFSLHQTCDALMYKALKKYHGSISAEHGIGIEKKQWLSQSRSETEISVMKALKHTLDPEKLLNPGRVFD